jgi:hypothetical protein
MAVIVTPATVRSILLRSGLSAATPRLGSKNSFNSAGFYVRTLRRQGQEYSAYHGVRYHIDSAVEVRHAFGEAEGSVEAEMEQLAHYASVITAAGWKTQIRVYGAALGPKLTSRFVEVG